MVETFFSFFTSSHSSNFVVVVLRPHNLMERYNLFIPQFNTEGSYLFERGAVRLQFHQTDNISAVSLLESQYLPTRTYSSDNRETKGNELYKLPLHLFIYYLFIYLFIIFFIWECGRGGGRGGMGCFGYQIVCRSVVGVLVKHYKIKEPNLHCRCFSPSRLHILLKS